VAAPSFKDYFDAGKAEALARRSGLAFDEGDISEFVVAGAAAMADHLTGYFADRVKATFLDGAIGDDLTDLADDHWNIQRREAVLASGSVSFTRTNANGAPLGSIPSGFVIATDKDADGNEIQYTTNSILNFPLSDLGPKSIIVNASIAGAGGNADIGKVTRMISTPFDSSFTITNTAKIVGGLDEETDEELRERVRALPTALRRGTLAALEYGALQVAGVAKATAVEELDLSLVPSGIVDVYVTDAAGNSNGTMTLAVTNELRNWRPAGSIVNVIGGAPQTVNVTVVLTARVGVDTSVLATNVALAITARINKLRINESLSQDIIKQAALNVDDNILSVLVTSPAVTVTPTNGNIIRAGTITVS